MRTFENPVEENGVRFVDIGVEMPDGTKYQTRVNLDHPNADKVIDLVRYKQGLFVAAQADALSHLSTGKQPAASVAISS